jgi:hypothetical protein
MIRADFIGAALYVGVACFSSACGTSSSDGAGPADGAAGSGGGAGAGGGGNLPGNSISGSVMGMSFTSVASSYWIGHPSAGGAPTQVYLSDERLACQALSAPGWDKTLAASTQLLEIGLAGPTPSTFHIGMDADANYLGGPFNPSADGGTVTTTIVNASQNIVGSFDIKFGAAALAGTFDAAFCEAGVEP